MKMLGMEELPEGVNEFYKRNQELIESIQKLNRIVSYYNDLKTTTLDVEYNIIAAEVEMLDALIQNLTDVLHWDTDSTL